MFSHIAHGFTELVVNTVDFANEGEVEAVATGVTAGLIVALLLWSGRWIGRLLVAGALYGICRFLDIGDGGVETQDDLDLDGLLDIRNADGDRSIFAATSLVYHRATHRREVTTTTLALLSFLCFMVAIGAPRSLVHSSNNIFVGILLAEMAFRGARLDDPDIDDPDIDDPDIELKSSPAARLMLVSSLSASLTIEKASVLEFGLTLGAAVAVLLSLSKITVIPNRRWVKPTIAALLMIAILNMVTVSNTADLAPAIVLTISAALLAASSAKLWLASKAKRAD